MFVKRSIIQAIRDLGMRSLDGEGNDKIYLLIEKIGSYLKIDIIGNITDAMMSSLSRQFRICKNKLIHDITKLVSQCSSVELIKAFKFIKKL